MGVNRPWDRLTSGKLEVRGPEIKKPVPPVQEKKRGKEAKVVTFAQPLVKLDETERKDEEEARRFADLRKFEETATRLLSENEEAEVVAGANTENRNFLSVSLGGQVYQALLDPGVTLSLISPEIADRFRERLTKSTTKLRTATGHIHSVLGELEVILDIGGKEQSISTIC
ncbi:hypothetical protein TSAR_002101 [Trichomalopsis sarcophagae]|uniref:Aspartic peptidase DDI1-type domain-containing protein n=1 Tax=Trichomalopsis sarcophagae TaxID=543379 RepID=A0A232EPG0_9HYME|nr:hypothetical protein TSAR_002101 [Trichomalopsis sarcophagae]